MALDDIKHFSLSLRMLLKGCYFHRLSDLVCAFSCGLAKTLQIYTLSVDTYFLENGDKISVFKNIRYVWIGPKSFQFASNERG